MITETELAFAEYIIDTSGAVDILATGMKGKRGPKPDTQHLRLLLLGLFLAVRHHGRGTITEAYRVLTLRLPRSARIRLGITTVDETGTSTTIDSDALFRWSKKISERLGYGTGTHPELSDAERARRHSVIRNYCDAMMDVFDFAAGSTMYALDATGLHAWSVARRNRNTTSGNENDNDDDTDDDEDDESDESEVDLDGNTDDTPPPAATSRTGRSFRRGTIAFDADAAHGYRSARDGEKAMFFGYHEHTLVQAPDDTHAHRYVEPRLIRRFELTPANADVVAPSLSLIDRLPNSMTDLIVDSHYHYKKHQNWKAELDQRGIRQHHDLRSDEIAFVEFERMRWVGGYAHCPATPDSLDRLTRPAFDASPAAFEASLAKFETRQSWAMQRHTQPDHTGTHRVVCPALAGKIGCPLRAGTVTTAIEQGLPIVEHPPTTGPNGEPLPKCCTQHTVKVTPPTKIVKLQQPHYWGGQTWERVWRRRTYVEGSYGNRKNVSTENMRRGITRIPGLAFTHITIALVNASYNLRMVRNWHEHTGLGDPDHPLLAIDDGPHEWEFIRPDTPEPEVA